MHIHHVTGHEVVQFVFIIGFSLLVVLYIGAVIYTNRCYKNWPLHRTLCWCVGILCAVLAVVGPLANEAHVNFTVHMIGHLLLGMLAPLLIVISAPMTLLLRTLRTKDARIVTRLLKSWPLRIVTNPAVATILNIGGLWLLYTTDLYTLMHDNSAVSFFVHVHILLAGYLFTISMIYIDPVFHRKSFLYRAIVLVLAMASHGILAKYLYAHPPNAVSVEQAQQGSMIMYYGGDLIDAIIIFILCLHWYRGTKPKMVKQQENTSNLEIV